MYAYSRRRSRSTSSVRYLCAVSVYHHKSDAVNEAAESGLDANAPKEPEGLLFAALRRSHSLSRALARKRFGFWCNINIGAGGGSGAHTLEVRENIFKDDLGRLELDARLRSVRYRPNVFCQLILAPNRQRRALNSTPLGMCVRVRLQVKYACITA